MPSKCVSDVTDAHVAPVRGRPRGKAKVLPRVGDLVECSWPGWPGTMATGIIIGIEPGTNGIKYLTLLLDDGGVVFWDPATVRVISSCEPQPESCNPSPTAV